MPDAPKVISAVSTTKVETPKVETPKVEPKVEMPMAAASPQGDICLYLPKGNADVRVIVVNDQSIELPGNQDTIGLEAKFPIRCIIEGSSYNFAATDVVGTIYNDTPRPCVSYL